MKKAVIINGVAGDICEIKLLENCLGKEGYETERVEIMDEKVDINKIKLNSSPDVIAGFSLGGMVALKLAESYPKAKLIIVASGCRMDLSNKFYILLKDLVKNESFLRIAKMSLRSPKELLILVYKMACPCPEKKNELNYMQDMEKNLKLFRSLSIRKWKEIFGFCFESDLREIAVKLPNKCLIFSGENDVIMPFNLGKEAGVMLKNSKLVATKGGHFDVIGDDDVNVLKEFIV